MSIRTITLSDQQECALITALDYALDDQGHLLRCGNPALDYGADWPEAAATKAQYIRDWAAICRKLGVDRLADDCEKLATEFEESITEVTP